MATINIGKLVLNQHIDFRYVSERASAGDVMTIEVETRDTITRTGRTTVYTKTLPSTAAANNTLYGFTDLVTWLEQDTIVLRVDKDSNQYTWSGYERGVQDTSNETTLPASLIVAGRVTIGWGEDEQEFLLSLKAETALDTDQTQQLSEVGITVRGVGDDFTITAKVPYKFRIDPPANTTDAYAIVHSYEIEEYNQPQ